jgi:tetratricopeptide (TPR) repeat protein
MEGRTTPQPGCALSAPPEEPGSSFAVCWRASAPFALLTALVVIFPAPLRSQAAAVLEQRVWQLYDSGHWAEAARLAAGAPNPSPSLLFYEGLSLARLKNFASAGQVLRRGQQLYPSDKRFPIELAGIAYRAQNRGLAKRYLRRALKLDPADGYARGFLATLFLLDENIPAALKYWNPLGRPLLQDVRFEPPPPLDPILRERSFAVSAGQLLTGNRLDATDANLKRLDILSNTRFDLTPLETGDRFNLFIHTMPESGLLRGLLGWLLPSLRELPYQGLTFDFLNIQQQARNFRSLLRWDPNKRRVNLVLSEPWRGNPQTEANLFVDVRDEKWNLLPAVYRGQGAGSLVDLSVRSIAAGGAFTIGLTPRLEWTVGGLLTYRHIGTPIAAPFFSRGWSVELNNRFDYLLWQWPERRMRWNAWGRFNAGHLFTNDPSRLITARGGIQGTWSPQARGDTYRLSEEIQTGREFGNVPLDSLFSLGMERDTDPDLWLRGVVATTNGRKGAAPLGREYWISQTDFIRKILQIPFLRLDAGTFFDAGWVGDPSGTLGSHGVIYDAGVQFKASTAGGVNVTLVYGRDLVNGRGAFYTAVSR